jgi:uncharacterized membrane protein
MAGIALVAAGTVAVGSGLVWLFFAVNRRIKAFMQDLLGDYFEYAAMLYWAVLILIAMFVALALVLPWWIWSAVLLATLAGAVVTVVLCS